MGQIKLKFQSVGIFSFNMMVLVNEISVIMMEYPISYREAYYLVKRTGIHFSALYRPNS